MPAHLINRKERRARDARRGRLGEGRYNLLVRELARVIRMAFEAGDTGSLFRSCLWCQGPIPIEARRGVIYCGKACQSASQRDLRAERRKCRHCGKSYRGHGPFCCHACYSTHRRQKHPKPCPVCGRIFKPHRHEQVTCSQKCRGIRQRANTCKHQT